MRFVLNNNDIKKIKILCDIVILFIYFNRNLFDSNYIYIIIKYFIMSIY
jgi:hypothetical protein